MASTTTTATGYNSDSLPGYEQAPAAGGPSNLLPITSRDSVRATCPMCTKTVTTYPAIRDTPHYTSDNPVYLGAGIATGAGPQRQDQRFWSVRDIIGAPSKKGKWVHHKCPKCGAVLASVPPPPPKVKAKKSKWYEFDF